MLANTAYESVKQYNDGSEIFEFFRHLRNASSHLNVFQFNHKEPANPANWRGAIFDKTLKGENNPLHGKPCFGHFIGVADLLDLLMDIEIRIIAQLEKNNPIYYPLSVSYTFNILKRNGCQIDNKEIFYYFISTAVMSCLLYRSSFS